MLTSQFTPWQGGPSPAYGGSRQSSPSPNSGLASAVTPFTPAGNGTAPLRLPGSEPSRHGQSPVHTAAAVPAPPASPSAAVPAAARRHLSFTPAPPSSPGIPEDLPHQHPPTPALLEARAGVQEAEEVLAAAQAQRLELWELANRLMAVERGRARAAEGQLWEAAHQARGAQLRAEAAEALAQQRVAAAEAAEVAAQHAQQQVAALQGEREVERQHVADLEAALEGVRAEVAEVREQADRQREALQHQGAELASRLAEQEQAASLAAAQAAAMEEQLVGTELALQEEQQRHREAEGRLTGEAERAANRCRVLEQQQDAAVAEAAAARQQAQQAVAAQQQVEAARARVEREAQAARAEASATQEGLREERRQREALQAERQQLDEQLHSASEHLESLAAECDALAASVEEARRAAREAEAASAAATAEKLAASDSWRHQLAQQGDQLAAQQEELSQQAAALAAQQEVEGQLRGALAETGGFAEAAEQEVELLGMKLRLTEMELTGAAGELQVARSELAGLQVEHRMLSRRWLCIERGDEACRDLELAELEQLVQMIEGAVPQLRNIVTERRVEAARSEMAAASSQQACIVCCAAQRDTFLSCGHLLCRSCSERMDTCPVCRTAITTRTRAFV